MNLQLLMKRWHQVYNRKKEEGSKGSPAWMTTFSDLMTLLLVFFVLLFAYSEIDVQKFRAIASSFKGVLDYEQSAIPMDNPTNNTMSNNDKELLDKLKEKEKDKKEQESQNQNPVYEKTVNSNELDELLIRIKNYLRENNLEGVISATREKRGIVLVLQEKVLFDSGQAIIKKEAMPFLSKVAEMIDTIPNMVEVEGHTDSQRIIQPSPYPTNWNLSGARAANVVNYLIDKYNLVPERFKIAGYAYTQPVASNETVEGRQKNRRVVIVILDSEVDLTVTLKEQN